MEIAIRGEHMDSSWRTEYHAAKEKCVLLFTRLSDPDTVWSLSTEFLYFPGLLQAAFELFPQAKGRLLIQEQLSGRPVTVGSDIVQNLNTRRCRGDAIGTDPEGLSLATNCFLWLEKARRPADILSLGEHCEPKQLLLDFLKV